MYKSEKLLIILSENAGDGIDISPDVKKLIKKYRRTANVKKVKTPPEITKLLDKEADRYDVIAVNGGDGSVIAAIKALAESKTKLLILPGGTANIVAREYDLVIDALTMLESFLKGLLVEQRFDIAKAGDQMLATDMHSGWWSEAILSTPRELKKRVGMMAYGIRALQKMPSAKKSNYELVINGKTIKSTAYSLYIANHGYQHFLGVPLFKTRHKYGKLQIAFIKSLSPHSLTMWWLGKRVLRRPLGRAIKTYTSTNLVIKKSPRTYLFDDQKLKITNNYKLSGAEAEISLLKLPPKMPRYPFFKQVFYIRTTFTRFYERFRNYFSGLPNYSYSKVAPKLFVGGQYKANAYGLLSSWGIKAVVNMRQVKDINVPDDFSVLQLKTKDWTPPTIEDLRRGVEFIDDHILKDEGVYIHCRLGEGRGPSMAAAYLVYKGMTAEEAVDSIRLHRPMARLNKKQKQQLANWQKYCYKNKYAAKPN